MKFLKIKSADMPTKPKPTEQLPNNLMYVWDPNANDWIILQKDTNKATPPLYDPNNQNVATNTTTYMSNIKSASVINGEEDEDPLSVKLSDLFLSDSSLVDSYIKKEISCNDILNILGIEIKNENEYKEVCNYVKEFIEDNYMRGIKSSSSLSVLPKLLDKVWYDYDEETAGKYAQIGDWEIGLGGYDTGYEVSYNGTPIFSITEDNELKPYMSDDRLQKDFGFSYSDVEKALKKHRDMTTLKRVGSTKNHSFYIKEDFPSFNGDTRVAVIEEDQDGEIFDWNYFDTMEEAEEFERKMNKKVKSEKSMMELAQNIIYNVVLIHKAKSMDERPEWDGTFAILTLNPEKTDIVDIKYIPQSSLPSYTPNDNEYGLVRTRDTGFDETDYQLQPLEMIIRQRKSDSFAKDDKNAIESVYKKQSSCLSKFLDGPRYSKEIKIESGLIKEGLVKYAGFDFNRGTKYAITDKGLEVLRKASEKEHNEALNEREKLAYMFGFNTDKETTLDTTGKVIKSDELSKCEWCGEEFDESELEDTELGKVCYRCKKGIESKEGPMNNKNISEAKQYLEKYLLENPELFKYQYGKDNVEEVLKELIEENPNWYKKFSSKKWTICEADGTPLGKVTASSELDAKVKFGIEHPEYADSQSICAKEINAQYEQTTNTKEPYPNPSETPHDDVILENHDGWVNTAEQKVTPEFAKLHSILGEYKKNGHILSITQDGKDLLVSCSPIASYEMKQKFEQLGYECEETDESETGDAYDLPSYTLRIKMK